MLSDGIDAADAFESAVLNAAPDQDQETLRQQCALAYDVSTVASALSPASAKSKAVDPSVTNPSPQGRRAASDFHLTPGDASSFNFKAA
jgi:hypothetical protein